VIPLISIPGYRVLSCLGRGGYGSVYLAESETLQRREAIKVLHDDISHTDRNRLQLEAQAAAKLHHPSVVAVYAFGSFQADDSTLNYISMEYFDGRPLLDEITRNRLLNLSFRERIEHFKGLCDAVNHFHSHGIVHGDLTAANVLYSDSSDSIKIVDFGLGAESADRSDWKTLFERDTKALSRLFANYFCVPPISTYRDLIGEQARSEQDILAYLDNIQRAGPPTIAPGPDPDHGVQRDAYAADALARYDEVLFRFCLCFQIDTRIVFGANPQLTKPYERAEDQAARRVHIDFHPLLPFCSSDRLVILDAIARVFLRDVTFRYGAWLREETRTIEEPLPDNVGFSDAPSATEGLELNEIVKGLGALFSKDHASGPASQSESPAPKTTEHGYAATILQTLQSGVLYNRLVQLTMSGYFGEYQPSQSADQIIQAWRRRDLLGDNFVNAIVGINDILQAGITKEQIDILTCILRTVPGSRLPDREATRKLLEHILWVLVPSPLMSLKIDQGFAISPAMVFQAAETGQVVYYDGGTLRIRGLRPGKTLSVSLSPDDVVTLQALIEFEEITRAPITQSYELDRLAIYGRRGIGNILAVDSRYLHLKERGWEQLREIVRSKLDALSRPALHAKLQHLLSNYKSEMIRDIRDGRIFADNRWPSVDFATLQSAGIVQVLNMTNELPHVFIRSWVSERIADVEERISRLLNEQV
jgi:serine/threonine protein kinase